MGTYRTFDVSGKKAGAHCARIVREALARGINFFDTAPMYGEAERVLGLALEGAREGAREGAVLATKVLERDGKSALASVRRSLKLLRAETIDLIQIHNMGGWRAVTPALKELQREGRVRFLGITDYRVSNYPEVLQAMRTGEYDTVQIPYYLGEATCRREVLPLAREMNLGVIVMTPISPMFQRAGLVRALAGKDLSFLAPYGVRTPGQALLKYLLADPAVSTVIPATGKVERVAENVAVSDGSPLPPEARARLERLME